MSGQNNTSKAVIYCRVSSTVQVTKGDGLGSQETRCREYANHKKYEIVEVFKDEVISGSLIDRQQQARQKSMLMRGEIRKIDKKVNQFLDRVVGADTPMLTETYENKVREIQEQKVELSEMIKNCGYLLQSFDENFRNT